MEDFEGIKGITEAAIGKVGDELTFSFPEVLKVIELCSANQIAVLGVELFQVRPDGHYAFGSSDYHLQEKQKWPTVQSADWPEYVSWNNGLAEECVRRNPLGDEHVYVLSTSSWREFCEVQATRAADDGSTR
jgi:hypothetical protein